MPSQTESRLFRQYAACRNELGCFVGDGGAVSGRFPIARSRPLRNLLAVLLTSEKPRGRTDVGANDYWQKHSNINLESSEL